MDTPPPPPRPWYREPWPWALMAGPAIVIVAGAVTVIYAVRSNDGLVAEDYYKRGLTVNRDLARIETARRLRIAADIGLDAGQATAVVQPAMALALPDTLTLRLAHPTRASEDVVVTLRRSGANEYRAPVTLPASQRWKLRLETPDWLLQGDIPAGAVRAPLIYADS